jgi:hypothetical protein
MPTIAHLLQPGIERKLEDIQASLPPQAVQTTLGPRGRKGYLDAQPAQVPVHPAPQAAPSARKGGQATKPDPVRNIGTGAPMDPNYMTPSERMFGQSLMRTPQGDLAATKGYLGKLGGGAFIKGFDKGAGEEALKHGPLRSAAGVDPSVAPMAAAEQKLAVPVHPAPAGGKHPIVIKLPAGAVGFAEDGQAVDKKGKKLGFLQQSMENPTPKADKSVNPSGKKHETLSI